MALLAVSVGWVWTAAGQVGPSSPARDRGWVSVSFGLDTPLDFSGGISLNYGRHHFWQLALQSSQEFMISGEGTNAAALVLARGYSLTAPYSRVAVSAGPAYVWGLDHLDPKTWERPSYRTAGLALNAQAIFSPFEMGIGLDFFVNVNPILSSAGVRLALVIEGNQ